MLLLLACGTDSDLGPSFVVSFDISRGARVVRCQDVPEIARVEARVFAEGGSSVLQGFPQLADCAAGVFLARGLDPGRYDVELRALGSLGDDRDAVLFRATRTLTVPDDAGATIRLEPQVAYLTLAWTFGDDMLAPCATEVGTIRVLVSSGSSQAGNFSGFFGCTDTGESGVFLPQPFELQQYTIQIDAESTEGYPLFSHSAQRFLEQGDNTYTAVLAPLGGQVFIDWDFVVEGDRIRMCDALRVEVDRLAVRLVGLEGGGIDFSSSLACAESRPAPVRGVRFTPGRELRLELSASGSRANFYGEQTFTMPDGDYRDALVGLERVGSATVAVDVVTSTCAPSAQTVYDVRLLLAGQTSPERQALIPEDSPPLVGFDRLPYGSYDVQITQRVEQDVSCSVTAERVVDGPDNVWIPVTL